MSRPKRKRHIDQPPKVRGFKPFGIPLKHVNCIRILHEEYEAIRLADYEMLTQEQAAERMQVSRPTFTRIYENARQKVATSFAEGQALIIEGGDVEINDGWYRCETCNRISKLPNPDECQHCHSKNMLALSSDYLSTSISNDKQLICLECNKKSTGLPDDECKTCCELLYKSL